MENSLVTFPRVSFIADVELSPGALRNVVLQSAQMISYCSRSRSACLHRGFKGATVPSMGLT